MSQDNGGLLVFLAHKDEQFRELGSIDRVYSYIPGLQLRSRVSAVRSETMKLLATSVFVPQLSSHSTGRY